MDSVKHDDVLEQHQNGEQRLQGVRETVLEEYKEHPNVLELSDEMQEHRKSFSHDHPEKSDNEYLYGAMLEDAKLQFEYASDGKLSPEEARDVPATSFGPFVNTVMTTPPESLDAKLDMISSIGTGGMTQMLFGDAPGNPFHDTDPKNNC